MHGAQCGELGWSWQPHYQCVAEELFWTPETGNDRRQPCHPEKAQVGARCLEAACRTQRFATAVR
jgi:hypothetical protein